MLLFATGIRSMLAVHWVVLFAMILAAWAGLFAMSVPADLRDASRLFGAEFWTALCTVTPDMAGFARVAAMWLLMSTAMMLPTALPAFAAYDDLARAGAPASPLMLAGGFLAVWGGASLVFAGAQMLLFRADLVSGFGDSRSALLSATLLAAAGAYQFSPLKAACLSACRAPVAFFLQHWDARPVVQGLRLGATCLGCCWALMLLAFVGGMASLAFMGLATLIMALEKLPEIGRRISGPLGGLLFAAAAWTAVTGI